MSRTLASRANRVADTELPLGEVLEFLRVIWQLDHALQRSSKQMIAQLGVTGPQRLVLRILGRFPGLPAGQLAQVLHLHPSTVTGILKRLERQGLLRRRADPRDARRSLLSLTEKGRSLDVETGGTVEAHVARVLAQTPRHRLRAACALLSDVTAALSRTVNAPRREPGRRSARKRA